MKQLNYTVKGQRLYKSDPVYDYYLVKGSENYLALHFRFSQEWNSVNKFVKFAGDDNYKPITNDVCQIPDSVIDYDVIAFSVIGLNVNDEVVITTNATTLEYDLNANIESDPEPQEEGKDKLSELDDVVISDPQDDQALFYDAQLGRWHNKNLPSRSDKLSELTDVDLNEPTDGQTLQYNAENNKWKNVDGMTASKVNQQIDDKLVPYSKVYNAIAIEYSESFLTLKAKINTTFSQPPFKLTDFIVLPILGTILSDQSPRYINILDVNDQSVGSFELSRRNYRMVDNSVYLIRINASNKVDIISSSVITSDNVSGLTALLNAKQNTLTAGSGISIVNDVISATGGGGGVDELSELTDVAISSPINKQTLKYDSITQKWVNANDDLTGLSDVTLNSPSNNQVLVYNGLLRKWVNGTAPSGVSNLSNLNDVNVIGVTNGQIIKWNSTTQKWESADEQTADLTNIPHVYTAYYLEQNLSTISVVINELSDNTVVPTASDFIIFTTISSDVFPTTTPTNIKFYASDEQTLLATKSLRVVEQFMGGNNYELFIDGNTVRSLTDNVNSVAQVNDLIDAKINALGNAEQEEF